MVIAELRARLPDVREETVPSGSLLGSEPSPMWLPPRLRLRPDGDGIVIAGSMLHRLVGDRVEGATEVGARPADAYPASDGVWVLDGHGLRRVPGGESVDGLAWERLLGDAAATYAVARRPATVVARIEPEGGRRELGPSGLDPVMDAAGRIAWVDAERSWNVLEPGEDGARRTPLAPGAEGVAVGLDDAGRGYLARATGLTAVEPDGSLAWSFGAEGFAPGPGGGVVTAHDAGNELDLTGDVTTPQLRLPDVGRAVAWRLIAADYGFLVWGGESTRGPGVLVTFDSDGGVERIEDPAPADARLRGWWPAAAREWQIDGSGRAHLTLAGPDGVVVVTLQG
jgi:hypothetical protein